MDEKVALSLNKLQAKLGKQIDKRAGAPIPDDATLTKSFALVAAPAPALAAAKSTDFFDLWDTYYPRIVGLLGWASWVIPGPALTIIKSLLAVVNNDIIPILRKLLDDE